MHQEFKTCINACYECAAACDHCAVACLGETDIAALEKCIRLDIDCAEICRLAAGSMARSSLFANQICRLCADICEACGQECARHEHSHCTECAEACKACATECRKVAA